MTDFIGWVLAAGASVLLLLATVLLVQVLAAFARRSAPARPRPEQVRFTVVMPAHDEARGIAETLARVIPELGTDGRILVVADNCSDRTADIARAAGADVVVRDDRTRRGKGYALDFAIRHLSGDPPEVVIILDADCVPAPGALRKLVAACQAAGRPLQALYQLVAPGDGPASPYVKIASFAWRMKNEVRPSGLSALGLPCQLMGTGMAFPWPMIAMVPLATGHLVEDMVLGLQLAEKGSPASFFPDATVTSSFPTSGEGQQSQRTRWESGHIKVIVDDVPHYLLKALKRGDVRLAALALDAAVPPLALLVLMSGTAVFVTLGWMILAGGLLGFVLAGLGFGAIVAAVILAWRMVGRDILTLSDFLLVPVYVVRKLAIYVGALSGQSLDWVRTKRD